MITIKMRETIIVIDCNQYKHNTHREREMESNQNNKTKVIERINNN